MSEENNKTQTETTTETAAETAQQTGAVNVRETKEFLAVVGQLNEARKQLQAIQDAKAQAENEEKERKAREAGDFESFKKQLQADKDAAIAQMQREVKTSRAEALAAGIKDEWARRGIVDHLISLEDGTDPAEFMAELKSKSPHLFETPTFQASNGPQIAARVNNGSDGNDWASIKAQMSKGSPKQVANAINLVQDYMNKNAGKMPPGF